MSEDNTKELEPPNMPDRIYIPVGPARLMAVSPELQNNDGAWYVRESSRASATAPQGDALLNRQTVLDAVTAFCGQFDSLGERFKKQLRNAIRAIPTAATSPVSPSPTPEQIVYNVAQRDPRFRRYLIEQLTALGSEQGHGPLKVLPAPPSTQPSARVAAEEILKSLHVNPSDPDNEDDVQEIMAIISRHFPSAQPVEEKEDGWVTFGRVKVDIENETETFERIKPE